MTRMRRLFKPKRSWAARCRRRLWYGRLVGAAVADDLNPNSSLDEPAMRNQGVVGRVLTRHVGLKSDLRPNELSGLKSSACGCLFFVHWAGAHTQQGVGRAKPENTCQQWYDADPAPYADDSGSCQRDERQTDDDAQNTIYATDVDFHFEPLLVEVGRASCKKPRCFRL